METIGSDRPTGAASPSPRSPPAGWRKFGYLQIPLDRSIARRLRSPTASPAPGRLAPSPNSRRSSMKQPHDVPAANALLLAHRHQQVLEVAAAQRVIEARRELDPFGLRQR